VEVEEVEAVSLVLAEPRRPATTASRSASNVGWDHDASVEEIESFDPSDAPITAQVLSLFGEPAVVAITVDAAARALKLPYNDVHNGVEALVSAGELRVVEGHAGRYTVTPERKAELEAMFRDAAHEIGETHALVVREPTDLASFEDEEEPRLPVTAGLLSVFLPGTGQLLNGDVGRASLVFAVWSLALLTNLSPIWTFVCLYAGAEAFFTAKVRGMERKLALEAAQNQKAKAGAS
jgi:hypothetical protein